MNNGQKDLSIDCEVYIPKGFGFELEDKYKKAIFKTEYMDFTFSSFYKDGLTLSLRWPAADKTVSLKSIYNITQCVMLIRSAIDQRKEIGIQVWLDKELIVKDSLSFTHTLDPYLEVCSILSFHTWVIAKYFDIQDDVIIKLNELFSQKTLLPIVALAFQHQLSDVNITYWSDIDAIRTKACYIKVIEIRMGTYVILVCLAIIGSPEIIRLVSENNVAQLQMKSESIRIKTMIFEHLVQVNDKKRTLLQSAIESCESNVQLVLSE